MIDVSVLIPCFNQAKHISHVIESVIDQTYPSLEIIVVDDASTDGSYKILEKLPVKLLKHDQNRGPAAARNTALREAHGEIVLFVDADAYADENLLKVLIQTYRQFPAPTLAGIGGRGIESNVQSVYDRWRKYHASQDFGRRPRNRVPYLYGLCASFKRDILLEVGGFDSYFPTNAGEDLDLGYRLYRAGYELFYIPEAIVYHQHSDSESSLKKVQYNWFYWSFIAKYRAGVPTWPLFVGTLRRLVTETSTDLIIRRSAELAKLDISIFRVKLSAILDANMHIREFGEQETQE